jgi:hypothetical protein
MRVLGLHNGEAINSRKAVSSAIDSLVVEADERKHKPADF